MSDADEHAGRSVIAEVTLRGDAWELRGRVSVPEGPSRTEALLPAARSMADSVVRAAREAVEQAGASVSCRAGCGACCRNLVAISEVEARRLHAVVEQMPDERRARVEGRFVAAREALHEAGLLSPLLDTSDWTEADYDRRYHQYFTLGLACPFLEDESCSIYDERPITCREYLVTSSPERCAHPEMGPITRVLLPVRVFNAVARWQATEGRHLLERWVPLITALEWAVQHPDEAESRPGPELLRELLALLGEQESDVEAPASAAAPGDPEGMGD